MSTHTKKRSTSFLLSEETRGMINDLAAELGIYQSAVVTQAIHRFNGQKHIKLRDEETKKISFWLSNEARGIVLHCAKAAGLSNSVIVDLAIRQLREEIREQQKIAESWEIIEVIPKERIPIFRLSKGKLRRV